MICIKSLNIETSEHLSCFVSFIGNCVAAHVTFDCNKGTSTLFLFMLKWPVTKIERNLNLSNTLNGNLFVLKIGP